MTTNQKRQRLENENDDLKFNDATLNMISGVFVDNNLTWFISQ